MSQHAGFGTSQNCKNFKKCWQSAESQSFATRLDGVQNYGSCLWVRKRRKKGGGRGRRERERDRKRLKESAKEIDKERRKRSPLPIGEAVEWHVFRGRKMPFPPSFGAVQADCVKLTITQGESRVSKALRSAPQCAAACLRQNDHRSNNTSTVTHCENFTGTSELNILSPKVIILICCSKLTGCTGSLCSRNLIWHLVRLHFSVNVFPMCLSPWTDVKEASWVQGFGGAESEVNDPHETALVSVT